ncbi:MAG: sugar transferase [Paludibacter sp.]|nr:sugar transferase [Paludibacter sp.]
MLTKREANLSTLLIVVQVAISIFIFCLTRLFFGDDLLTSCGKLLILVQIAVIWFVLFNKFRMGVIFRNQDFFELIRGYLSTIILGSLIIGAEILTFPFIKHRQFTIQYLALFSSLDLFALILFKYVFYYYMRSIRSTGHNSRMVVLLTNKEFATYVDQFIERKDWGYNIKAIISPDKSLKSKFENVRVIANVEELIQKVTLQGIDDIFYCLPVNDKSYNLQNLLSSTQELGISLHIMQPERSIVGYKKDNTLSFITHQTIPSQYLAIKLKHVFDIIFSAIIIVVALPLLLLIALGIKLEDGGPVFFKQERIGLNGRRFYCHKFRSMVVDAEELKESLIIQNESDGPNFKIENDPRITCIGRILRRLSLDEFPQFYNVLKGEMSVVGPRPPLLDEVVLYKRSQLRRLSMKPGITCLWQVSGRNALSFSEWMCLDLHYIDNWSIWLDLKIIIRTVGVMFKANGQ